MNPAPQPTTDQIRDTLRGVIDPEVGINIVDLGLVYDIRISPEMIAIDLTMTSPACPMSDLVLANVGSVLAAAWPDAPPVNTALVWNPPWKPKMMSDQARKALGW